MSFNFDSPPSRYGTGSLKWDYLFSDEKFVARSSLAEGSPLRDLLPLWVADMDFSCPEEVITALTKRAEHGIFGYTAASESYYESFCNWSRQNYHWDIKAEWIVLSPGVVPVMNSLMSSLLEAGDKVIIQPPIYYHFMEAPRNHGIEYLSNELLYDSSEFCYSIDFADFEKKAADPKTKAFMLCNPHNPSTRVWSKTELKQLAEICLKHKLLIISDEIHCDLVYPEHAFTPIASLSKEIADSSITLMAASKTFNLAGFPISQTIITNSKLRDRFKLSLNKLGVSGAPCLGLVACEAAYQHGRPWLSALLEYTWSNYLFCKEFFASQLPQVKLVQPQGTYLLWADFKELGLKPAERKERIYLGAKVFLNEGKKFGLEGADFERFNLACSRQLLEKGLERISKEFSS